MACLSTDLPFQTVISYLDPPSICALAGVSRSCGSRVVQIADENMSRFIDVAESLNRFLSSRRGAWNHEIEVVWHRLRGMADLSEVLDLRMTKTLNELRAMWESPFWFAYGQQLAASEKTALERGRVSPFSAAISSAIVQSDAVELIETKIPSAVNLFEAQIQNPDCLRSLVKTLSPAVAALRGSKVAMGRFSHAVAVHGFDAFVQLSPKESDLRTLLVTLIDQYGELDLALKLFDVHQDSLQFDRYTVKLCRALAQHNRVDQLLDFLRGVRVGNVEGHNIVIDLVRGDHLPEAHRVAEAACGSGVYYNESLLNVMRGWIKRGRIEQAESFIGKINDEYAREIAMSEIADAWQGRGDQEQRVQVILSQISCQPAIVIGFYLRHGRLAEAEKVVQSNLKWSCGDGVTFVGFLRNHYIVRSAIDQLLQSDPRAREKIREFPQLRFVCSATIDLTGSRAL